MQHKPDRLFATEHPHLGDFQFDQAVVDVFPDMINRSVPGYTTILQHIGQLAQRYAQPNTQCYDLGCSLGAASLAMSAQIEAANTRIIAVDNSPAMIARAKTHLEQRPTRVPVDFICAPLQSVVIENAALCVLNFTLQFIPIHQRSGILQGIAEGLIDGGVLILSEKLAFDDPQHQALMIELHHNFKRSNGYSDLEIAQKRSALENVLIPETLATHQQRLLNAGFRSVELWFQCFNFASMIAFK